MSIMLEVKHLTIKLKEQIVLNDVSLTVEKGNMVGIVGHNGSGKSVLFKCICGLYKADKGEVWVDGKLMREDIDLLTKAGIIIESPAFLGDETAFKNLEYLYCLNHKKDKEHIKSVLKRVGLEPLSKKKVKNYSMGMKQRLAIAQAIMEDHELLILDEPMNGLDKNGVKEIRDILLRLKEEGKTIILTSHIQEDIDILCDNVYEMELGVLTKVR